MYGQLFFRFIKTPQHVRAVKSGKWLHPAQDPIASPPSPSPRRHPRHRARTRGLALPPFPDVGRAAVVEFRVRADDPDRGLDRAGRVGGVAIVATYKDAKNSAERVCTVQHDRECRGVVRRLVRGARDRRASGDRALRARDRRPAGGAWRVAPVTCLLSRAPPGAFPHRQYARRQRRAQGVPDRGRVAPKLTQRRADPRSWRPAPRTGS